MMRKWICICLVLLCICPPAAADTLDILKPMWLNALEGMKEERQNSAAQGENAVSEPVVTTKDAQLEVVRYAVYMNDKYSTEAYVYAELKNVGETIIRPDGVQLDICDPSGKQIAQEKYASYGPQVVAPGESLYVKEWLYDFVSDLSRVASIDVSVERSEYSRRKATRIDTAKAYIEGDYLYAELTNASDEAVFGMAAMAVALDKDGRILDVLSEETYSSLGAAPGSTIVMRKYLDEHALDAPDVSFEAWGYVYEDE